MSLKKEPTERSEKEFEDVDIFGQVSPEEFSGLFDMLSKNEEIDIVTGVDTRGGKRIVALTNFRLICYSSSNTKLLGEKRNYCDINLNSIKEINVEDRKGFDAMEIITKRGRERMMLPSNTGMKISGRIRELQDQKDPFKDLDNLSKQRDKKNISEDEYERKKKDILERI